MGVGDFQGLPSEERQLWLLEQLRELVQAAGSEPLLQAPLVEPTPRFFPLSWAPDVACAADITRRLLDQARLNELGLHMTPFVNEMPEDFDEEPRYIVGFFRGIEQTVCDFGIHVPALDDPEYLAGVMAHEVAHAFRHHHRLVRDDHDIEEELTDLTTVYLGTGVLTANVAERSVFGETLEVMTLQRSRGGYLPVEDFAFLLGIQLVARGGGGEHLARMESFLDSGQRYCLRHALQRLQELELDERALHTRLGIENKLRPGTAELSWAGSAALTDTTRPGFPWGRVVYRARPSLAVRGGVCGLIVGGVLSALLARTGGVAALGVVGVGPLVGFGLGQWLARGHCSNASCGVPLARHERECPGCHGYVLGTLDRPPEKFATGVPGSSRVKRVVRTRMSSYGTWGFVLGAALGLTSLSVDPSLGWLLPLAAAGALLGALWGRSVRRDICSTRECETELPDFVRVCPRCLKLVVGEARSEIEAL